MDETMIKDIVSETVSQYLSDSRGKSQQDCNLYECREIPVEASGRHVHLSKHDVEILFGSGHELTPKKAISQPGQFLCEERVTIVGEKNKFEHVAVLGPVRKHTQVELSCTDAKFIGVDAPVAMSGELANAADIEIVTETGKIKAVKSTIIAKNHLHISTSEAKLFGLNNGDYVDVSVGVKRPVTFNKVLVRAGDGHKLAMHIDYDEANSCLYSTGDKGVILCNKGNSPDSNVQIDEYTDNHFKESRETEANMTQGDVIVNTHYLSERQIEEVAESNILAVVVKKGTIISPLAHDYAVANSLEIKYL